MTPFDSPLFWALCVAFVGGVVGGAVVALSWAAPRWLLDG